MIQAKDLNKTYNRGEKGEKRAISHTTVSFDKTGFVCILGESGSGKTTLMNTIGGLEVFDSGEIIVDEIHMKKYAAKEYEQFRINKFAYIFQNYLLLEDNTVAYNIRIALEPFGISEDEIEERISAILTTLKIQKLRDKLVRHLSGGQKQRVAIARAVVKSPEVIFADEPTGNLDEANTIMTMNLMKELSKTCLVLLVTHDREMAEGYADRMITVQDGQIISDKPNVGTGMIRRHDDMNIYLQEYEHHRIESPNVTFEMYGVPANKIALYVLWEDGKYYIQKADGDGKVVFLDEKSEIKMLNEPAREMEKTEDTEDIHLDMRPIHTRKSKIPFRMIHRLASQLSATMGKKKLYLSSIFVINAIMLVLVIAAYLTAYHPDKTTIIHSDSRLISVGFEADGHMEKADLESKIKDYYQKIIELSEKKSFIDLESGFAQESKMSYGRLTFTFYGNTFQQEKLLSDQFTDFSVLPDKYMDKNKMICGTCKDDLNSIVIDKWLADRLIQSDSIALKAYKDYNSFIGKQIQATATKKVVTITGVCDTGEPTMYANATLLLELAGWTDNVAYGDSTLYRTINQEKEDSDKMQQIEKSYDQILQDCIKTSGEFVLLTNNGKEVEKGLKSIQTKASKDNLRIKYTCKADDEMKQYEEQYATILRSFTVAAVAAMFLSIVMIYFMMKSNVLTQKHSLMIYMINGVTIRNLTLSYLWEMLGVMNLTILPTVVLLSCGIKGATKLFSCNIVYSFWVMLAILLVLYILNIICIVIPVHNILRRPIAQQGLIDS